MRMTEEKKMQEARLIEEAKAYFEKHGLTEAFAKFFVRRDVGNKMQGAYNQFERYLGYFQEDVEKCDCPAELKAIACEVAKSMSGKKEAMDEAIKNMLLCSMFGTFSSMGAWVHMDDQVLAPFKDAMVTECGNQLIYTFEALCEGVTHKMWGDTIDKVVETLKQEDGAKVLMSVVEQSFEDHLE